MKEQTSNDGELVRGMERFFGHVVATVLGVILMIVGIGLGVGLVTLPLAIPVGFAGLFLFLWGLFGRASSRATSSESGSP